MYENLTVESIKSDIKARCAPAVDTREGSFFDDMIGGVAYKYWEGFQALDAILPIAFVDETSGVYLEKRAAELGITRKTGAKAATMMHFTGTDGTVIPAGKAFLTSDGLEFATDEAVTISSGAASVQATAAAIGEQYNVGASEITQQLNTISGLTSFDNDPAEGGTDDETDTSLYSRLDARRKSQPTSGNPAHYKQWAREVSGVGDAKIFQVWAGPGTVKAVLVGPDYLPVDSAVETAAAEHIEEMRPVVADVTVISAVGVDINVSVDVELDGLATLPEVQEAFDEKLAAYLAALTKANYALTVPAPPDPAPAITIIYNYIAYMLLGITGVGDFTSLTVNGGTSNITLDPDEVPVPGTAVIT